MSSERFETILERCLERIATGEDLETCLRDEPEHAERLAPLLEARAALREWEPPRLPDNVRDAARTRALDALGRETAASHQWRTPFGSTIAARVAIVIAIVAVLAGAADTAGHQSLPGEMLYPWKRAKEDIALVLASGPSERAQLQTEFAKRRLDEIATLVASGNTDPQVVAEVTEDLIQNAASAIAEGQQAPDVNVAPDVKEILATAQTTLETAAQSNPQIAAVIDPSLQRADQLANTVPTETITVTTPPTELPTPTDLPTRQPGSLDDDADDTLLLPTLTASIVDVTATPTTASSIHSTPMASLAPEAGIATATPTACPSQTPVEGTFQTSTPVITQRPQPQPGCMPTQTPTVILP
jgi:hypothetical protein